MVKQKKYYLPCLHNSLLQQLFYTTFVLIFKFPIESLFRNNLEQIYRHTNSLPHIPHCVPVFLNPGRF